MKYVITHTELTCINILIRTIQEAINRNAFTEQEITKIVNVTNLLAAKNKVETIEMLQ